VTFHVLIPNVNFEENIKAQFEFPDLPAKRKRRESSCIRRDSRIGLLINKSNNLKQYDNGSEEMKFSTHIVNDKFDESEFYEDNTTSMPFDTSYKITRKNIEDPNLKNYTEEILSNANRSSHSIEYKVSIKQLKFRLW
jgi:hypothetical protein